MFSLHDTSSIRRNAHEHLARLQREARIARNAGSTHTSSRVLVAGVIRRIATWIERWRPAVRGFAGQRPRYGSDGTAKPATHVPGPPPWSP